MARYTGPKVRLSRRVGAPIEDNPKHTSKRQLNPPGMHGFRGRRLRDYGIRLQEKQKLRYHYHVMEKQFARYVDEAKRLPGNSGEILMQLARAPGWTTSSAGRAWRGRSGRRVRSWRTGTCC